MPVLEKKLLKCCKCGKDFEEYEWEAVYCQLCIEIVKQAQEVKKIEQEIGAIIPKIYQTTDSDRDIKDFLNKSVFCYGPAGTGKTQFIATLAKHYIRNRYGVIWLSYPVYVMRLQTMYRNDTKDPYEYVMNVATTEKILILDDIGIEKQTDFLRQTIYMLVNQRYERQEVTLITSNKTLTEIDNIIHPGISSRIAGMCQVLEFKGRDLRIKK